MVFIRCKPESLKSVLITISPVVVTAGAFVPEVQQGLGGFNCGWVFHVIISFDTCLWCWYIKGTEWLSYSGDDG